MGWRELHLWINARSRSLERAARAHVADPNSWKGRDQDQFWAEQDRKRGRR